MKLTEIPKIGDILVASWGWEQTNIDFFQVTKVKNNTVWIRHLKDKKVVNQDQSMTGLVTPIKNSFKGAEKRRRARMHPEYGVLINAGESYGTLDKWSGQPEHYSFYG